jgi:hypothetical protein
LITELEFSFLCACQERVIRTQEVVPLLAHHVGVLPEELFYHFAIPPRPTQHGLIDGSDWTFGPHGLECDLKNTQDGRFLQLEFGPHGRYDTFTGWGVLQFVMTTKSPWREFPELKAFLTKTLPPYNKRFGSHAKMKTLADRLEELQLVEVADQELCALKDKYTQIQPDGSRYISWPPEYKDYPPNFYLDTMVCYRWILSELGKQVVILGAQELG